MNRNKVRDFALAGLMGFALLACGGAEHELGDEPDSGVAADARGGTQVLSRDGTTNDPRCGPNGEESCVDGNRIVRCQEGQYETVETCDRGCAFVGQDLACEGGSRLFTPAGVGLIADGAVRASISTVGGAIGCGLADDYALSPGTAGEQVYLVLANVGIGCTEGIYGLDASCDIGYPESSSARCAIYRRWTGTRLEAVEALSGAVTITAAAVDRCEFQVELILGGQTQVVRFSADLANAGRAQFCPAPS